MRLVILVPAFRGAWHLHLLLDLDPICDCLSVEGENNYHYYGVIFHLLVSSSATIV